MQTENTERQLKAFAEQVGFTLEYLDETTSTNDVARDPRYDAGAVVIAERQSCGRGQRGNSWSSPAGRNLTFSLVLCPGFLKAEQQFYLSKAVSLAVCDTIESLGIGSQVKWPNDIYIAGRKAVGILIENDLSGNYLARSVVGIGINVNQTEFDPALPNPVSLAVATGRQLDRTAIFRTFYERMSFRYGQLQHQEYAAMDADYVARLYRLDEEHPFVDGRTKTPFRGTICGVLPTGELQVRHGDGRIRHYLFKEIEYSITGNG